MSKTPHDFAELLTPVYKNWMQLDPQFASKNENIDEKMLTTGKSLANRVKIFIDDARAHLKPNLQFDNLDDLFKMLEEVSSTGAGFPDRSLSEKLYIELDSLINAQKSINWTIFIQLLRQHLRYDFDYKN